MLGDQFLSATSVAVSTAAAAASGSSELCSLDQRNSPQCIDQQQHLQMSGCFDGEDQTGYVNHHRAIRYYPPLMEQYHHHLNSIPYQALNQKRESVITFNSNIIHHGKQQYLDSLDLSNDDKRSSLSSGSSTSGSNSPNKSAKYKSTSQVSIDGLPFTIEQIVCICQVLQKSDLQKLEKFIYTLPVEGKLAKNELILRARAIAAYHSANYKEVYDILEGNTFSVKYHQELQNLWNNAHYKEHEMKRGHPPGAVEKYRIRKKFQFPRTIWDGEEYVYCFKEKNRRVLKEFYQKCNLPTQEDKMKLSSQTQLTVVQISNWFKNRRQRDRQPNHHEHDKTLSDAHSNVTNDSSTPSPPMTGGSGGGQASAAAVAAAAAAVELFALSSGSSGTGVQPNQHHQLTHHGHHQPQQDRTVSEDNFCLHGPVHGPHRPYYFLSQ